MEFRDFLDHCRSDDLAHALRGLGLPVTGNKPVRIARLGMSDGRKSGSSTSESNTLNFMGLTFLAVAESVRLRGVRRCFVRNLAGDAVAESRPRQSIRFEGTKAF